MSIFFLKINFYSILPILFYRFIGFKVYFLECDDIWRGQATFALLSKIGISWMSHQSEEYIRGGAVMHDCYTESMRIGTRLTALPIYRRLLEALDGNASLKLVVCEKLQGAISGPIELLHCIKGRQSGCKNEHAFVWFPNTLVTQLLLESYPTTINKCPKSLSSFEEICRNGLRALTALVSNGWIFLKKICSCSAKNNSTAVSPSDQKINYENIQVAYFPHQGVFYSNLYVKDHFYSTDPTSPFHCSKVAHFEVDGFQADSCEEYYKKNNIRNYNWSAIPASKLRMSKLLAKYIGVEIKNLFLGIEWDLLVKFSIIYWSINYAKLRFLRLPNLKIVMIGYDILFPPTLAYACRLMCVKTVAVQERMVAAWWMPPLILDHYFVIGPEVCEHMQKTFLPGTEFHVIGPVRIKDHLRANCPSEALKLREKYSSVVLAMDFHSEPGWYENGRKFANNWRSNAVFYDHLLKLCVDFPKACFLLKGKNYHFNKIPFFKEYILKFENQHNLILLADMHTWTPFSSVMAADIGFARQTSLADEMLALGKPVVFDDYDGFPSEVYDYGAQVTSYNYKDLRAKFSEFFANPGDYNAGLNALRKKLYTVPVESAEVLIQKKLNHILFSQCK